jgi:hypothetical protein
LNQPFTFPSAPTVFVGGYREGNHISYCFAEAHLLFAEGDMIPVQLYHFEMHPPWISRMTMVPVVMFPRAWMYPIPQFVFLG